MTIDRLTLRNFLLFTGNKEKSFDSFDEHFINGINVFIGENGTGKSTLLKCIYSACEWSRETTHPNKAKRFRDYFSTSKKPIKEINQKSNDNDFGLIRVYSGENELHFRAWDSSISDFDNWLGLDIKSVLIPTAEMLSHSKGLLAMASKWDIPFDATQTDILVNVQLPETNELSERNRKLLKLISDTIGGEVVYENDEFYVIKENGFKIEFSLEAEGFRRLGLIWKLIRNGLLERGSILLWDEPEASINPELMPLLADILYILKNDGVQVFLATHNYLLTKYLDIKKQSENDVLFISLRRSQDGEIKTARASKYSLLEHNSIETAEEKLFNAVIEKTMEA